MHLQGTADGGSTVLSYEI